MTYTVLFIVTLIPMSGLIAYLGDLLGRRMGKRRLTLFGMRPRYTAIVMTIITGMLIAGLTLATLLAASSSLRQVLDRGKRLDEDIKRHQVKNKELREKNLILTATGARLSREVRERSERVRLAEQEAEKARRAEDDIRLRVEALQAGIKSSQNELAVLKQSRKLTEERLRQYSDRLDAKMAELKNKKAELARRDEELAVKRRDLADKTRKLADKMAELIKADQRIREAESTIKRDEITIQEQRKALVQVTQMLLMGDVVLQQGQEMGRKVIDSTLTREQIRAELVDLLDGASDEAKRAQAGSDNGQRAIQLVFNDPKTHSLSNDEKAGIDGAVEAIVEAGHSSQVRGVLSQLVVVNNTLKGDRALVTLNLYWNSLKFRRGEKIASRIIDGRMSEGRILLSVNDLLGEDVRAAGQKAGIVPVASPDPDEVDQPISGGHLDELMELVEKIKSENMRVEVQARAKKDIYAAGPLTLDNIQFAICELTSAAR